MSKSAFQQTLESGQILLLDGAMGTMLQKAGLTPGESPETFCSQHPDILKNIHLAYLKAGSNIITSATFGANPFKMPGSNVAAFNKRMAQIAREAIIESGRDGPLFVAGDVGPSGMFAKPLGDVEPEALMAGFREQISGLAAGGVDLIFMETQFDLAELRLAIAAARQACDLPVMASMTFEQGVSLTGTNPEIFAATMENMGCAALGANCSLGPDEMLPVIRELCQYSDKPVLAEPNAGLPELIDGKTVFPLPPGPFAEKTARFAELGAQILGGCCGTTPEHIQALVKACASIKLKKPAGKQQDGIILTSRSKLVHIAASAPLTIIGERINPTGKPKLAAELQNGSFAEAMRLADAQIEAGAAVLDVNVGAPLVDETQILPELACALIAKHLTPLSLDSSNDAALAKALPYYPGSCLINSISGENRRMQILGPLCRDFGAPFILLPLQGTALPKTAVERIDIIEKLLDEAMSIGIPKRLIMIDILALAVSSFANGAKACLQTLAWCREHQFATTLGLSNISFGLPARPLLNATFLAMGRGMGLASCIANPDNSRIQEAVAAMSVLMGFDSDAELFINNYKNWQADIGNGAARASAAAKAETLFDMILYGNKEKIMASLEQELAAGKQPLELINTVLIPAITEVGRKYEKREYFLPQLIRSAETMQKAFSRLQPLLEAEKGVAKLPVIVMATVEGDIHDIGKNIVSLLLGNHGFTVIDAGKDVPASKILEIAKEHDAKIIGLSALMTTTMVRMADTINLLKEHNLPIKVMVGGAAVTQEFADSIGADAYCEDAVSAVAAAKRLLAA